MERIDLTKNENVEENLFAEKTNNQKMNNVDVKAENVENQKAENDKEENKNIEAEKRALQEELNDLYIKEYNIDYINKQTHLGGLRSYLLKKDMRKAVYKDNYFYSVLADTSALAFFGAGVLIFAPEYFAKYFTVGSALVACHLSLPHIYDKTKFAIDEKLCYLRAKLLYNKKERIIEKQKDLYKQIQSLEK